MQLSWSYVDLIANPANSPIKDEATLHIAQLSYLITLKLSPSYLIQEIRV
jgi:hypothetical protein